MAARIPATEIEAYEDDTRLHFDVESDFPRFLDPVLRRTDQISQTKVDDGGGRKGGPKTAKPHRNTPKNRMRFTASDFFPNTETARTCRPQYES